MAGEGDANMAETPNWRISVLFLLIVVLSLVGHLFLHWMEEYFRKNKRKGLKHTLESLKDELFALGLITLMLIVLEDQIIKICIKDDDYEKGDYYGGKNETLYEKGRRLLAGGAGDSCKSGYEPLWSLTVLHDTHIFIFLIAVVHLVYAATSIILASLKVRGWRKWEDLPSHDMRPLKKKWTVKTKGTYFGLWISAFFTQFLETVDGPIYLALRRLFIERMELDDDFDFHHFVVESMEEDFAKMVEFEWLMWLVAAIWILLPSSAYIIIWLPCLFLFFQLVVGAKLESVIIQLATLAYTNYSPHFIPFKERKAKTPDERPNLFKRSASAMRNVLSRTSPKLKQALSRMSSSGNRDVQTYHAEIRQSKSLNQTEANQIRNMVKDEEMQQEDLKKAVSEVLPRPSAFAEISQEYERQNGITTVTIDAPDSSRTGDDQMEKTIKRKWCWFVDTRTNKIVNRSLSQHFAQKYLLKDAADLFWFRKPKILLRIFQYSYFQSGLATAILVLEKWKGGFSSSQKTSDALTIIMIGVNLVVMIHAAVFLLPMYALTTAAGSHCPERVLKKAFKKNVNPELAKQLQLERSSFTKEGSAATSDDSTAAEAAQHVPPTTKKKTTHQAHLDPHYTGPINILLEAMNQSKTRKRLIVQERPDLLRHSIGAFAGKGQITGRPIRALATLDEKSSMKERSTRQIFHEHDDGCHSEPDLEDDQHATLSEVAHIFQLAEDQGSDDAKNDPELSTIDASMENQFRARWLRTQNTEPEKHEQEIEVVVDDQKEQQRFNIPVDSEIELQRQKESESK